MDPDTYDTQTDVISGKSIVSPTFAKCLFENSQNGLPDIPAPNNLIHPSIN